MKNLLFAYNQILTFSGEQHFNDPKSGVDVFIRHKDGYTIVEAFYTEGVWPSIDWRTNFRFLFTKWKRPDCARPDSKIKVHGGYFNGWAAIRERVLTAVDGDKVLVCGLSMGGGLASIIAVDIQYNKNPPELYCFDFDGPKVWNKAGRDSFNKRVPNAYKIKNGNDIVTKVPPGYYYAGKKIHIGSPEHWWKFSIVDHNYFRNYKQILTDLTKIPD